MNNLSDLIKSKVDDLKHKFDVEASGRVISISDNIAVVWGLRDAFITEKVEFISGHSGMIIALDEYCVKVIIFCVRFSDPKSVKEGDIVTRTHKPLKVKAGMDLLSRVVNGLGELMDGKGPIISESYDEMDVFAASTDIIDRKTVSETLWTGIKSIDAMIPIGLGQRELIIGDRQTGKSTIAIDMVLNQAQFYQTKPIYCVYVFIGQKKSDVARTMRLLHEHDAMKYTIIVAATAADGAADQYIAPYVGCAIAESLRNKKHNVLLIFDDLSKHAVAYREISLLLRRAPGREAYPGDTFFIHSTLLERAACCKNGGSITAIPIIETQAGDISSYIATNVISITDGQIFLDESLFNMGIRPSIDVGKSVSRVGSAAQAEYVKATTSTHRLTLSQKKELEVFAKLSSDVDAETLARIRKGQILEQLMLQGPNTPLSINEEVLIFHITKYHLDTININNIQEIVNRVKRHPNVWKLLNGHALSISEKAQLDRIILEH